MKNRQEDSLLQNEDIVLFINGDQPQNSAPKRVPLQRYPFEHALKHKLQTNHPPFSQSSQKFMRTTKVSSFAGFNSKMGFGSTIRQKKGDISGRQGINKNYLNMNIMRISKEVNSLLRKQGLAKSLPFRVVRSLSTNSLKKKGQVEQQRRIRARYNHNSPFQLPFIQSEYIT